MTALITLLLFVPLVCAVLSLLLSFRGGRGLAILGMLAQCWLAALLLRTVLSDGPALYPLANWMPPLGIALRIDALAVVMLCLTALIATVCGLHAGLYLNPRRRWQRHFWSLYWFLWAGLNGVWLADDLFNLYVGLELVSLCAVGLVALDGRGQTTAAALRYVFAALLGSMFYLLGVALLYAEYGLLSLQLLEDQGIGSSLGSALALVLMLLGLAIKTALWPFHGWLPPAHAGAKSPVSAMLSALVVKASFYIAWRLWVTLPVHFPAYQWLAQLLGLLGSVAVFYGGYRALTAVRLKQLVAYSSVSQIGYLFLLFPLCASLSADVTRLVQQGILLHLVSHALAKAAMFLAAGNLVLALGSSRVVALAGVSRHLPLSLFGLGLAGVSLMGLPPSGGFVGKWLLLQAVFVTAQWWWLLTLLLGGLLTATYIFRLYLASFVEHGAGRRFTPPALSLEVLPLLLAVAGIALGFLADPLLRAAGLAGRGDWLMSLAWLPVLALLTSLLAALGIFLLPEQAHRTRIALNLLAAVLKLSLVGTMAYGVFRGVQYHFTFALLPGLDFVLRVDALSLLFAGLSSVLWLCTTIYAIGYLEDSPNRSRFFGFFSLCVASTMGIALAGNLITFFIFYELLTLSTFPLVVHRGTEASLRAGRNYIIYTLTGGAVLLLAIVWLNALAGSISFADNAGVVALIPENERALQMIFVLLIGGLGVKAALVPLHGWLPQAMVAPAPVSALLHAVAVVKAGAFGIVRVVYDIYGVELATTLDLLLPLALLASVTILYGSLRALREGDLKRRLAFSTISQVSYIVLGVSLIGPLATAGALVHLVHQGFMKVTLFFCAGNFAETLGVHRIRELDGAGRRMPATSALFTVAALGMIGLPPTAGFVTKWMLGSGVLASSATWLLPVLLISSVLNAMYFLPIIYRLWFVPRVADWPDDRRWGRWETSAWLLWPTVFTGSCSLVLGLLAGAPFSPLFWAQMIAVRAYGL